MPNKKILSTLLTLLCITGLVVFYQFLPSEEISVSAAGESWLTGYDFRKPITITNSGSALTDFQVEIDVTYDSDMQTDFDDIRFTASDGDTELNYWLESKTDSTSAVFWIKLSSIPNGDTTVYMYYGNGSVSTTSNGSNTFIFFDDFNSLDNWTPTITLAPLYEISTIDGVSAVHLKSDQHNEAIKLVSNNTYSGGDMVMESRVKHVSFSASDSYFHLGTEIDSNNFYEWSFQKYYNRYNLGIKIAGVSASVNGSSTSVPSGWYNYSQILDTNTPNLELLRDDVSKLNTSPAGYSSSAYSLYIRVNQWNSGTSEHYVDWIFGRKHASSMPTYITGAEEYGGSLSSPTISEVAESVYYTTADVAVTIDNGGALTDITISGDVPTQTLEDKSSGTYTFNLTSLTVGTTYSYTITATNSEGSDISNGTLDTSYTKERPVTITNSGSALTDFQIEVDVTYDSDMQTDFDDIRFTASDESTELKYWLESKTDSTSAVFWVKVPSIPNGDSTIYMFYGNTDAVSMSDGDNTFIFFDDFDDNSIDSNKWTVLSGGGSATVTETGGEINVYSDNTNRAYLKSSATYAAPYVIECKSKKSVNTEIVFNWDGSYAGTYDLPNNGYEFRYNSWSSPSYLQIYKYVSGSATNLAQYSTTIDTNYHDYKVVVTTSTTRATGFYDGAPVVSTTDTTRTSGYLGFSARETPAAVNSYYDDIRIRKYAATDPTTVVGEEIEESGTTCSDYNVWGWAYSSTSGPISFSCKNCDSDENGYTDVSCGGDNSSTAIDYYGVNIDTETGEFSGYAWSESVGTISFNSSEIGTFPTTPSYSAKLNLDTGEITGWARAISACDWNGSACTTNGAGTNMGGWDGWIKFSGDLYGVSVIDGDTYGEFSGSAWGGYVPGTNDSVLGEIRFSGLTNSNIQVYTSILLDANVAPVANFHVENSGNSYCVGEETSCSAYTKYSQLINDSTDTNGLGDIVHTYWYMRPSGVGEYSLLSSVSGRTNYTMQLSDFTSGTGAYDVKLLVEDSGALTSEKVKTINFQSSLEVDYSCCVGDCTEDSAFEDCSLDKFSKITQGSTLYFRDNTSVTNYSVPSAGSSIQTRTWTNATKDDDYNAHATMDSAKTVTLEASDTIMSGTKGYTFGTVSNPSFHEIPLENESQ